jgi:hypothetical protein
LARIRIRLGGRKIPATEIAQLLRLIDEGYSKPAWHGPNLRASVRGLSAHDAAWRPAAGRHNIWEIVVHAAYWKYVVRCRLLGGKRAGFALPGDNWFERSDSLGEKAWRADLNLLDMEYKKLREVVAKFPPSALGRPAPGHRGIARVQIAGVAFHDVYHAGQIQLLRRLLSGRSRK